MTIFPPSVLETQLCALFSSPWAAVAGFDRYYDRLSRFRPLNTSGILVWVSSRLREQWTEKKLWSIITKNCWFAGSERFRSKNCEGIRYTYILLWWRFLYIFSTRLSCNKRHLQKGSRFFISINMLIRVGPHFASSYIGCLLRPHLHWTWVVLTEWTLRTSWACVLYELQGRMSLFSPTVLVYTHSAVRDLAYLAYIYYHIGFF
jgi:hypothetical protein